MGWWSDFAKAAASEMGTKLSHPLEAMQAPSRLAGAVARGVISSAQGTPIKFTPEEFEREGIGEMVGAGATGLGDDLAEALFPGVEAQRSALQDWAEAAAAMGSEGLLAGAAPTGAAMALAPRVSAAMRALPITAANEGMRLAPGAAARAMEMGMPTPELVRAASSFAGRQAGKAMEGAGAVLRRGVPNVWSREAGRSIAGAQRVMNTAPEMIRAAESAVPAAERAMTLRDMLAAIQTLNPTF